MEPRSTRTKFGATRRGAILLAAIATLAALGAIGLSIALFGLGMPIGLAAPLSALCAGLAVGIVALNFAMR